MTLRALPLSGSTKTRAGGRPRDERAPPNAFADWLRDSKMPATEVAKRIAALAKRKTFSVSSVYNIRNGYFVPGRSLALAIQKLTRGKVPVGHWDTVQKRVRD